MGRFICHHDGWFFEWSEVVDAPVSKAMTRTDFEAYFQARHGTEGMCGLSERLERAVANGSSALPPMSLEDVVAVNRAGPDETEATLEQVLAMVGASKSSRTTSESTG